MASPAVAVPAQLNGDTPAAPSTRSQSPMSISSSSKRKRDDGDNASPGADPSLARTSTSSTAADDKSAAAVNGTTANTRDQKALIGEYFRVLQRYDADAGILKQPLPDFHQPDAEPEAKRRKSGDDTVSATSTALSVEDKVLQNRFTTLEEMLSDVTRAAKARIAALKSSSDAGVGGGEKVDGLVTRIDELKEKAHNLYRRELAYPSTEQLPPSTGADVKEITPQTSGGRALLMTYATINNAKKPLLSSLQNAAGGFATTAGKPLKEIAGTALPPGFTVTHAVKETLALEKPVPSRTLGELFPSPRNLPPLQPPKPNKGTTRSNVLSFYHPALADQSSYRTGTYFSQNVTTGQWLDYSNATPATHKKTKQRERAQSLAGVKPSSTELEMSEMEALFRGAFSSFAPCKDDSGAVVSSGQVSRMHWQRYGRRNLQRLIDSEGSSDETPLSEAAATDAASVENLPEVNEDIIKEVIETWDEAAIDPSLSDVMGQKSDEEKEAEDVLQEVTDLIETLASYQRNRNMIMPTSQDRFSTDPPNGDMLRNGAQSHHQPSEEELLTYQALKAQLSLIIQTLPPFAVARINSDKLEELSVSTKIEIRTDDFKGIMEEDDRAVRSRQVPVQSSAPTPRAAPQRTPSISGSAPYQGHHQYGGQYAAHTRSPMPAAPHYPQTPGRGQPPTAYQRPTSAVPIPQPHQAQARHAAPPPQQYRTPNGYAGMAPQVPKPPPSYTNMAHFPGTAVAGQPRMPAHQGFPAVPSPASPNHRFQQPYPPGYGQPQHPQQQQQPGQLPMHPPQHGSLPQQLSQQRPYAPFPNGAGHVPQRTMSPQVGMQPQTFNQSPTPPQQHQQPSRLPYGTPNQPVPPNGRSFPGAGSGMPPHVQGRGGTVGATGYATVMGDAQQKHVVEQARQQVQAQQQAQAQQQIQARLDAQSRASTFGHEASNGNKVSGLAGIGLSGNMDIQRMAAMRAANMGHGNNMAQQSPKSAGAQLVRNTIPAGHTLNGGAVIPPSVANSMSPQAGAARPAVGGNDSIA